MSFKLRYVSESFLTFDTHWMVLYLTNSENTFAFHQWMKTLAGLSYTFLSYISLV